MNFKIPFFSPYWSLQKSSKRLLESKICLSWSTTTSMSPIDSNTLENCSFDSDTSVKSQINLSKASLISASSCASTSLSRRSEVDSSLFRRFLISLYKVESVRSASVPVMLTICKMINTKPTIIANNTIPVHAASLYAVMVGLTLYNVRFCQSACLIE